MKNKTNAPSPKKKDSGSVPPEIPREEIDEFAPQLSFPIVGIGASAGGLAAFEAFFSGMPANDDPGMAFVLVQHLAPDHKSILTDLIRRYTRMQVFEVEDGMKVEINCTYIIPPNRDMAFLNGTLQLMEPSSPRGQRLPIDFFFRSLAADQHERAIGVVLSGTGSDGTLGVRAIKGEGGMVVAQKPESTEYDSMPRNAIATGMVDYELPPAEMAAQIISYATHALGNMPRYLTTIPLPKMETALKKIFILLRAQTKHDFSQYKPSTIQRRIERRLALHQIATMDAYIKFLQQTPTEVEALFRDLLIGVTNFFRDPQAFTALEQEVIPKIFAGKAANDTIRVWVPGCSTGEEAYSLAILMQEAMEGLKRNFHVQIFATDIDSLAIDTARQGVYPLSINADITPERLAKFFALEQDTGFYRINKSIRDMIVFSEQNLISDPPFSKLDLISCRNLLIYLNGFLQKKIIPLFHYALKSDGILFLGTSETVGEYVNMFTALDRKQKIYQRKEDFTPIQESKFTLYLPPIAAPEEGSLLIPEKKLTARKPLREITEHALLQQTVPAAALVTGQGDILYLHGRTGLYLEMAPGETGINNVIKMAREGLRRELTTALHKSVKTAEIVCFQGLRVKTNAHFTNINLTIRPVDAETNRAITSPLFLVIFEEVPDQLSSAGTPSGVTGEMSAMAAALLPDTDERITLLQKQLKDKEEYLQTSNEELETSNEELKSSNEEMQSVNEELQSTNEELETSKEELQSVNEELATVNTELQNKVADLSQANNDMNNLLAGTGIATIFVDYQMRIMRFTPATTKIINLILSDIGRPVGHIVSNLRGYDSLVPDIQAVLDSLVFKEVEVQTTSDVWFVMRMQPYRTIENVIEGVVISFVDITNIKQAQKALQESETRFRTIFEYAPVAINISRNQIYLYANKKFLEITGLNDIAEVIGKPVEELYPPQAVEESRQRVRDYRAGKISGYLEFETVACRQDGSEFSANVLATEIQLPDGPAIIAFITDITLRKQAEEALRKANELLRLAVVVRDAHDAITVQDLTGRIIAWNPGAVRIYGWTEAEALAMNVQDRIPEELQKPALAKLVQLSRAHILEPYLTSRIAKDGSIVEVSIVSTALVDEAGKMYAIATTERVVQKDE